jgi:hypothetical protein
MANGEVKVNIFVRQIGMLDLWNRDERVRIERALVCPNSPLARGGETIVMASGDAAATGCWRHGQAYAVRVPS